MFDLQHLLAYFIYYAVAGWCIEVIYAAYAHKKFINRGFLNGPVCPIYGVGAIIVVFCLTPFEDFIPGKPVINFILLFLASVFLTSLLELVVGWILERFFHQKWWDYTDDPLNFKGYVCVPFSLMWGGFCVLLMKLIHPFVTFLIGKIPDNTHTLIFLIFYILFGLDLLVTVAELAKIGRSIRLASDLDKALNKISGILGKPISAGTLFSLEQKDHLEKAYHALVARAKKMYGEHYKDYRFKLSPVHLRIQKAYPDLHFTNIEDVGGKISKLSEWVERVKSTFDKNSEKNREKKERRAQAALEKKNARFEKQHSGRHARRKNRGLSGKLKYGKPAAAHAEPVTERKTTRSTRKNKRKKP